MCKRISKSRDVETPQDVRGCKISRQKAHWEVITREPWISVFIPIPEEPTLGTQQKSIPDVTLRPKIPAGGPGRSFPREPKPGLGGWEVQKIYAPGAVDVGLQLHTQRGRASQTGRRRALCQPRCLTAQWRRTYRRDQPSASRTCSAPLERVPKTFRRKRDVITRRRRPGRLPAEVCADSWWGGAAVRVLRPRSSL